MGVYGSKVDIYQKNDWSCVTYIVCDATYSMDDGFVFSFVDGIGVLPQTVGLFLDIGFIC